MNHARYTQGINQKKSQSHIWMHKGVSFNGIVSITQIQRRGKWIEIRNLRQMHICDFLKLYYHYMKENGDSIMIQFNVELSLCS